MLVRRTFRAPLFPALAAAALLALTGCDSGSDPGGDADAPKASGSAVIAPGKPGEAAETLSAEDAAKRRAEDDSPNAADFAYAQMMIKHHTQAVEMTELVPSRAESTQVKRLAARISAAQQPEIDAMKGWLKINGDEKKGTSGGHDHEAMPGMATEAQLEKLRAAKGKAFDQLFLTLMTTHHEGAITMATDLKAAGNNILVEEMADDVIAQQTAEMSRMREML
ncbi:DUF305 domain-containing protein [Streptomyces bluensis]|uniref:DUF305 domain-containing protein n=1 Tax=Streptomyces bluensis TaxID=33897 RepID=UPI00167411E4|nr:DUF305 domain-containing protein [Streptomyces bluensis]GGZ44205.1 lipoprotein [Streptomyces bluensis]